MKVTTNKYSEGYYYKETKPACNNVYKALGEW